MRTRTAQPELREHSHTCLRPKLRWPLLGTYAGAALYLEVLFASLATGGTIQWAWPDDSCAATRVVRKGVVTYPDCQVTARANWAQRALQWPSRALHGRWRLPELAPQELRLPPHADRGKRWSAAIWITVGMTGFAVAGAAAGAFACFVRAVVTRRQRDDAATPDDGRHRRGLARRTFRTFLLSAAIATAVLPMVWLVARGAADGPAIARHRLPKIRPLTRGPAHHFFGYYDKLQFDPTDRYVLGLATTTENRFVEANDRVEVGMIDLASKRTNWTRLGDSRAWNWQQGCMLQWIPGTDDEIIWNDREGNFHVDLGSGDRRLVLSLADVVAFERREGYAPKEEHYIEMVQLNPSGARFVLFERWIAGDLRTRVLIANLDGSELHLLSAAGGNLSHVAWLDDTRIVIYATAHDGYAVFEDRAGYVETLLATSRDGHESFLAGGEWMLSDTYGDDQRVQHPFLYHLPTQTLFAVAHLMAGRGYEDKLRCDNHPRTSRDGRRIVVDSAHHRGRQMYLIDIGEILDTATPESSSRREE